MLFLLLSRFRDIYFLTILVVICTYLIFSRSMYWQSYVDPGLGSFPSFHHTVNNVHVSCCFYVTAQSNIRQWPVSLQKSPPSKIKPIRSYSSFQPEPVPFRNAITSAWYAWCSSVPLSFICPSPVPLHSSPQWPRWIRPYTRESVLVAPQ